MNEHIHVTGGAIGTQSFAEFVKYLMAQDIPPEDIAFRILQTFDVSEHDFNTRYNLMKNIEIYLGHLMISKEQLLRREYDDAISGTTWLYFAHEILQSIDWQVENQGYFSEDFINELVDNVVPQNTERLWAILALCSPDNVGYMFPERESYDLDVSIRDFACEQVRFIADHIVSLYTQAKDTETND